MNLFNVKNKLILTFNLSVQIRYLEDFRNVQREIEKVWKIENAENCLKCLCLGPLTLDQLYSDINFDRNKWGRNISQQTNEQINTRNKLSIFFLWFIYFYFYNLNKFSYHKVRRSFALFKLVSRKTREPISLEFVFFLGFLSARSLVRYSLRKR